MKTKTVALTVLFLGQVALAKMVPSLKEADSKIDLAQVSKVMMVDNTSNEHGDQIQVRFIEEDMGQSTDLSPMYVIYMSYFHAGEMNNIRTAFKIESTYGGFEAKKIGKGKYLLSYEMFNHNGDRGGFETKTVIVDANQVFKDDRNLKVEDFEDPYFESSIEIVDQK